MGSTSVHVRVGAVPGPVGPTGPPLEELLVLLSPLVPLLLDVDVLPDAPELPGAWTPLEPDELDEPPTEFESPELPGGGASSSPHANKGRATPARTKSKRPKRMSP